MSWVYLGMAIVLEVAGTSMMKWSEGFERLLPSILLFVLFGLSLAAETLAMREIDVIVTYAVWSGVGTALISLVGVILFGEPMTVLKGISLVLIVAGVFGLNAGGPPH